MNAFNHVHSRLFLIAQKALVVRGGQKVTLDAFELVIGDIVFVRAGDRVPADIRILEAKQFKVSIASI